MYGGVAWESGIKAKANFLAWTEIELRLRDIEFYGTNEVFKLNWFSGWLAVESAMKANSVSIE